jgi:hypothetical protein
MSLLSATLIPGLLLLGLGVPLLMNHGGWITLLKRFPRSQRAAYVFFGAGAIWFLTAVWNLSMADFGEYRTYLFIGFAIIAVLSFKCVPDFLAVRGLCALVLMGAMPLLMASYMNFDHWQPYFCKVLVYVAIALAIWLSAQPWRLRDFFQWLFARPERTRAIGAVLSGYGLLLSVLAFTY